MFVTVNVYQPPHAFPWNANLSFSLSLNTPLPSPYNSPERTDNFAYSSLVPFHFPALRPSRPGMKALKHDWLLFFFICKLEISSRALFSPPASSTPLLTFPSSPLSLVVLVPLRLVEVSKLIGGEEFFSSLAPQDWFWVTGVEVCVFFPPPTLL